MKFTALVLVILLSGCSIVAPTYQVSIDNVQQMKRANIDSIAVNEIKSSKDLNSISLRGSKMKSASDEARATEQWRNERTNDKSGTAAKVKVISCAACNAAWI